MKENKIEIAFQNELELVAEILKIIYRNDNGEGITIEEITDKLKKRHYKTSEYEIAKTIHQILLNGLLVERQSTLKSNVIRQSWSTIFGKRG